MMDIEYNDEGYVDLETPIFMTERQTEKFKREMKKIFGEGVVFKEVKEKIKEFNKLDRKHKKWLAEDLYTLVSQNKSHEEMAKILGRKSFSIIMKRGSWLLDIHNWAKKKGITEITKKDIEDYLNDN